jgi:hypothetical protein
MVMNMQEFIPIDVFCRQHGIEISFISSLKEFGLIEVISINEAECIPVNQLVEAEKLVRLHDELEINMEGIDVVSHLLARIRHMQDEIVLLKNRLRLYEINL